MFRAKLQRPALCVVLLVLLAGCSASRPRLRATEPTGGSDEQPSTDRIDRIEERVNRRLALPD